MYWCPTINDTGRIGVNN